MTRISARIDALKACWRFSRWGADRRSRRLLFHVGLLNCINGRRTRLRAVVRRRIAGHATGPRLELSICGRTGRHRNGIATMRLRLDNAADYQSLFECWGIHMYVPPDAEIHHVVDGGANIGGFSIFAAHLAGVRDIVAIEPNPENLELLRHNLASHAGVEIIAAALSDHAGTESFELADANTGHLRGAPGLERTADSVQVECRRLTEAIPASWDERKTWIKLDIEGAEYVVVRDLLAAGYRPAAISGEVHGFRTSGGAELLAALEAAGYRIRMLADADPGAEVVQFSAVQRV
jgi:FkbM family methyltransferase